KHWAEVASGPAEPGAEHECVRGCGRVRHHSLSWSIQPGRFVLANRLAPRISRVQRTTSRAKRSMPCESRFGLKRHQRDLSSSGSEDREAHDNVEQVVAPA